TLIFQVAGQQLSVSSTRAIISRLEERFSGHMPSSAELLAADPKVLRESGFSVRKGQTLRALAERFVDGRLSEKAFSRMTDEEIEAALTDVPGIGPWTARGFLLVALERPDVFLSGDLALGARRSACCASSSKPIRKRLRTPCQLLTDEPSTAIWMSCTTSLGWDTIATWLAGTSTLVAPVRSANIRSTSGGIASSLVAT